MLILPCNHSHGVLVHRQEGRNGVLRRFQQLRSYRDVLVQINFEFWPDLCLLNFVHINVF